MLDTLKAGSKNPSKNPSMKNLAVDEFDKRSSKSHRSSKPNLANMGKHSNKGSIRGSHRGSFIKQHEPKNIFTYFNEESVSSSDTNVTIIDLGLRRFDEHIQRKVDHSDEQCRAPHGRADTEDHGR